MWVSWYITSAKDSKTFFTGAALSPQRLIAIPRTMAKTMICRMLPDAMAAIGLVGTIDTSVSTKPGRGFGLDGRRSLHADAGTPGWRIVPMTRPKVMAIAVVAR